MKCCSSTVALGSHSREGTLNMSFMMKNREGTEKEKLLIMA
jgi:hypothetical protein